MGGTIILGAVSGLLWAAGDASRLRKVGFSAAQLKGAGFKAPELKLAGFMASEMHDYAIKELLSGDEAPAAPSEDGAAGSESLGESVRRNAGE